MGSRYWLGLVLLASLLAHGLAQAISSPTTFELMGAIQATGPVRALFHTGEDVRVDLSAASLEVTIYQREGTVAVIPVVPGGVVYSPSRPSDPQVFHEASAAATGPGRIGLYAGETDSAQTNSTRLSALSMLNPRIGEEETGTPSVPSHPFYSYQSKEPALVTGATGEVVVDTTGALWVHGPTLTITSDEGTTTYETGEEWITSNVVRETWAVLRAPKSQLQLAASPETQIVFSKLTGSVLRGESRMDFTLTPSPLADGEPVVVASTVKLAPPSGVWNAPSWAMDPRVGLALVGAVVVTGAAVVLVRRARARVVASDPAEAVAYFEHYAFIAHETSEFGLALDWLRAAREAAPEDADLAMWEATLQKHLGNEDAALKCYAEAARLAPTSGEPDYWAAVLLMESRRPGDLPRAMEHLESALSREPALAGTVERDSLFAPLHGQDFDAMLADAEARLQA